ncbi:LysM-like peptidoglycan-binding domain-containing protein [Vibrio zhugei]|uniref:LysM-like peptidoglycan-binding domain-containing protein n=1 Tax=Vibrio zhugei TaxID=2479546 RepID=A0ABV7C8W5_9VIBR|nr:LysM-like peptidoglycan-binding domain-containing protein [Vibrio zhugei]
MNRRRRKKSKPDNDFLQSCQQRLASINWSGVPSRAQHEWQAMPSKHRLWLKILTPVVIIVALVPLPQQTQQPEQAQSVSVNVNSVGLSRQVGDDHRAPQAPKVWHQYIVKQGDTLAAVFRENDLSLADLHALVSVEGADKPLSRIQKGQIIRYKLTNNQKLDILQVEKSDQSVMFFRMADGSFGRSD